MTAHKKPIDHRPFRSKTDHRLEEDLAAQYRGLAIPEVKAALESRKARTDGRNTKSGLPAG